MATTSSEPDLSRLHPLPTSRRRSGASTALRWVAPVAAAALVGASLSLGSGTASAAPKADIAQVEAQIEQLQQEVVTLRQQLQACVAKHAGKGFG